MNQSADKPIHICILKEYLKNIIGDHYPIEIIELIIMADYQPIKINCGWFHTTLISTKTHIWGSNNDGRLGLGHSNNQNSPQELGLPNVISTSCGGFHTITLTKSGKIYVWGWNNYGQLGLGHNEDQNSPQELGLQNIISINCGAYYTIALTKYGKIYVWGHNDNGQLGLGHNRDQNSPQELTF